MSDKKIEKKGLKPGLNNNPNEVKTTGHEWDGITEYDNPDPRWLRITFYCAVLFSLFYWIAYPSMPTFYQGMLGWRSDKEAATDLENIHKIRHKYQEQFDKMSFEEVQHDKNIMQFALAGGASAFANNCAVCHGAGGTGNPGYPNLTSGAWLWGGTIDDIYQTLKYGIRAEHEETRDSVMAAFGKDKILTHDQVLMLTHYVLGLYEHKDANPEAVKLFMEQCASCHSNDGSGNRAVGAPALNDAIWLYGKKEQVVYDVIFNGRAGVMPYWSGKLTDSTLRQLAIYVHSLGGGE